MFPIKEWLGRNIQFNSCGYDRQSPGRNKPLVSLVSSPNQLAICNNPKLLPMANKRRLALTAITCVKSYHIALAHRITSSGDIKYFTRDHVCYKQADSKE